MDAQKILTILVKEWLDQHGQTGTITIQKKEKDNENIPAQFFTDVISNIYSFVFIWWIGAYVQFCTITIYF